MKQENRLKKTEIGMIPEDWDVKVLSDVFEIIGGGTPKTSIKKYWGGNICWLSVADFNGDNKIVHDTEKKITEEGLKNSSTKLLDAGDLIISARGTVGELAQLGEPMAFNQSCYGLRGGNNSFLYYLLKYYLLKLKSKSHGSVFSTITRGTFETLSVAIPSDKEQKAIAKILSDLDSKIETLQKQNETLENMGQLLFRRWFKDFEFPCLPVGAGKPYELGELSGVCTYKAVGGLPGPAKNRSFVYVLLCNNDSMYIGLTDDIYKRWYEHKTGLGAKWTKANEPVKVIHWEEFDSREEAAKREKELKTGFGRKWLKREYEKLIRNSGDLSALESKLRQEGSPAPKSKLRQAGEMVESELGEIPAGWKVGSYSELVSLSTGKGLKRHEFIENGKYVVWGANGVIGRTENYLFDEKLILTGRVGTLGTLHLINKKVWISDNVLISKPLSEENYYFAYFILKSFDFKSLNCGSTQPLITQTDLKNQKIITPDNKILKQFHKILSSFFEEIDSSKDQIQSLTKLRDTLLPKLMNGKVGVK